MYRCLPGVALSRQEQMSLLFLRLLHSLTLLRTKSGLTTAGSSVSRSSESYFQQRVDLPRLNTLCKVLTNSWWLKFKCPSLDSCSSICLCCLAPPEAPLVSELLNTYLQQQMSMTSSWHTFLSVNKFTLRSNQLHLSHNQVDLKQ